MDSMVQKTRANLAGLTSIVLMVLTILSTCLHASEEIIILLKGPGMEITQNDFQQYFEIKVPEEYRAEVLMDAGKINELLEQLYKRKILEQQAIDLKLDQDIRIRQKIETAKRDVLVKARLEQVANAEADVNWELKAREHYTAHRNKFHAEESIKVFHILISQKQHEGTELRQIAQQVHKLALGGKQSFEDLALQYSEDPSAKKNAGNLGRIQRGQMAKPFEDAAFALQKVGDISSIVETEFGLHVIKLAEKIPARQLTFNEVKSGLIEEHKNQYRLKKRNSFLYKVRDSITYVNRDAIQELKKKFETPKR